jgi:hypothetical protein
MKLTPHFHLVSRSNNEWSYTFTPPIRLHGVVLSLEKAWGQLYFTLLYFTLLYFTLIHLLIDILSDLFAATVSCEFCFLPHLL